MFKDFQRGGDFLESQARPEFQVDHGALVGGEFAERGGEFGAKGGFVRIICRGKDRELFCAGCSWCLARSTAAAHQINGGVVREAEEKGALVAGIGE